MFICTLGHLTADTVKEDKARIAAQNWFRHYAPENKKSASVSRFSEYKYNERTITLNPENDSLLVDTYIIELNSPPLAKRRSWHDQSRNFSIISDLEEVKKQQSEFERLIMENHTKALLSGRQINIPEPEFYPSVTICMNACVARLPKYLAEQALKYSEVRSVYKNRPIQLDKELDSPFLAQIPSPNMLYTGGKGIVIGFLDSGVDYNHPDLGGGYGNGFKVKGGYDFVSNDNDPMDDNGHGTRTAGIAAANGVLFKGIAPEAEIMAVKVADAGGTGYTTWFLYGMDYLMDPDGDPLTNDAVDIINISLGNGVDPAWAFGTTTPIDNAVDAGIIVVAAVGNSGPNYRTISEQASSVACISVGACDSSGVVSSFSSRGTTLLYQDFKPEIAALGVNVLAPTLGGSYQSVSGTSYSAPRIAGISAVLLERNPAWTPEIVKSAIMNGAVSEFVPFETGCGNADTSYILNRKTAIFPAKIHLGIVDCSLPTNIKQVTVFFKNDTGLPRVFYLSDTTQNGVITHFNIDTLVVLPLSTDSVTVTFSFDTALILDNAVNDPQWLPHSSGVIITDQEGVEYRIAYTFIKSPSLHVEFNNFPGGYFIVHNNDLQITSGELNHRIFNTYNTLLLNGGTYDFIALARNHYNWTDFTRMMIEDQLHLHGLDTIIADGDQLPNKYRIELVDENDEPLDQTFTGTFTRMNLRKKSTGFNIGTVTWSVPSGLDFHFSRISDDYVLDWFSDANRAGHRRYHFKGSITNVDSSVVYSNNSSDFKHFFTSYRIPSAADTLSVSRWVDYGSFSALEATQTLYKPFHQHLYLMKDPSQAAFLNFGRGVYQTVNQQNWYYVTPWLNLDTSNVLSMFMMHDYQHPLMSIDPDTIKFGSGPATFSAISENMDSYLDFKTPTYFGVTQGFDPFFLFVLNQCGDAHAIPNLAYELYDENSTFISGGRFIDVLHVELINDYLDKRARIGLPVPGKYTLRSNTEYFLEDTTGILQLEYKVDTRKMDKNAPHIKYFHFFADNQFSNTFCSSLTRTMKIGTEDEIGIDSVNVYYRFSGSLSWHLLATAGKNEPYVFQIPLMDSAGYYDIKIIISDSSQNTNSQSFIPAFYYYPGPVIPKLLLPANDSITNIPATFYWSKSAGALSYTFQLSDTPEFNSILIQQANITDTTMQLTNLAHYSQYWWRVNAVNLDGICPWSEPRTCWTIENPNVPPPGLPVILYPMYNQKNIQFNSTLLWKSDTLARKYLVQYSRFSDFNYLLGSQWQLSSDTSHNVFCPEEATTYFWRIKAIGEGGSSEYSYSKFRTINQSVTKMQDAYCVLSQPNGLYGNHELLTFGGLTYFPMIDTTVACLQFDLSGFPEYKKVYEARLRLVMWGQQGSIGNLFGLFPITEAWNESTISWITLPDFHPVPVCSFDPSDWASYNFQNTDYYIEGLDSIVQDWIINPELNFGFMIRAMQNIQGFPYIRSMNNGNPAVNPAIEINYLAPQIKPVLLLPGDSSVLSTHMVQFCWNEINTYYHIQVSTDSLFNSLVYQLDNFMDTCIVAGPFIDSTQYYWRVRTYNMGGSSDWSSSNYFFIHDESCITYKKLSTKIFLEGAYNAGTLAMNNVLVANDLIPSTQPYSAAPWNYNGEETITSMPEGIIDWVLVELRQAASPELATEQTILPGWPKALLLKSDGSIVGVDNNNPFIGNAVITENLYVVIRHRNHLDVMSSGALTLTGNTYSYDFTDTLAKAYGAGAGYKQIGPNVYGMVAGDMDADGSVSVLDFSTWAAAFGMTNTYHQSDADLDGGISVLDYSKWAINFGMNQSRVWVYRSQVPD